MTPTTPPSDAPPVGVPLNGESVRLSGDPFGTGLSEPRLVPVSRPTAQADKTAPEGELWRHRADLKIVADTMQEMQEHIERLTGARHSMYDGAIGIACQMVRDAPNDTPSAPSRMASDAPAEGVGEALESLRAHYDMLVKLAHGNGVYEIVGGKRVRRKLSEVVALEAHHGARVARARLAARQSREETGDRTDA